LSKNIITENQQLVINRDLNLSACTAKQSTTPGLYCKIKMIIFRGAARISFLGGHKCLSV